MPIVVSAGGAADLELGAEDRAALIVAWYDTPGTCVARVDASVLRLGGVSGASGPTLLREADGLERGRLDLGTEEPQQASTPVWPWVMERGDILVPSLRVAEADQGDSGEQGADAGARLVLYLPDLFEVASRVTKAPEGAAAAEVLLAETGLDLSLPSDQFYSDWTATLTAAGEDLAKLSGLEEAHAATPYSYIHWLESDASLELTLDLGTDWPPAIPQASAIPTRKAEERAWFYPVMPSGGLNGGSLPAMASAWFVTQYVHPSVVELPSGWLMILGRVRVPHVQPQNAAVNRVSDHITAMTLTRDLYDPGSGPVPVPVGVQNSLSDVVAYWSPDPGFRDGVRGPVLLVHCLEALPDQTVRVGLGVPAGAVATTWRGPRSAFWNVGSSRVLYVYYTVNVPDLTTASDPEPPAGSYPTFLDPLLDSITDEEYSLEAEQYRSNGSSTLADRRTPMALKVIAVDDLMQAFDNWLPYSSRDPGFTQAAEEAMDTHLPMATLDPASSLHVPGELMGIVRSWIPTTSGSSTYEALEDHLEERIDTLPWARLGNRGVRFVDPEPAWCADEGTMALYFCCRRKTEGTGSDDRKVLQPGTGYGIWRALAMPEGETIAYEQSDGTGSLRLTEAGVDLVVSAFDGEDNPDLAMVDDLTVVEGLAASGGPQGHYADPAVARLPDGTWRLFASGLESGVGIAAQQGKAALGRVDGSHEDGCGT